MCRGNSTLLMMFLRHQMVKICIELFESKYSYCNVHWQNVAKADLKH